MSDLTFIFKIVNGIIDSPDLLSLITFHIPVRNTRSKILFNYNNNIRTESFRYSLVPRLHAVGNTYAEIVDVFNCTEFSYKKAIMSYLFNLY